MQTFKGLNMGILLAVQWLGTEIPQAAWCGQRKERTRRGESEVEGSQVRGSSEGKHPRCAHEIKLHQQGWKNAYK